MRKFFLGLTSLIVGFFLPLSAYAHEVYVLSKDTIERDVALTSPNPFSMISPHRFEFFLWAFISIVTVIAVLMISATRRIEEAIDPLLMRIKKYAPLIARITIGMCFIASAYFHALFGPELPFADFAGSFAPALTLLLSVLGVCFILGFYARAAATAALAVFACAVFRYGSYMLTYLNYFGEILVVLFLGGGIHSLDRTIHHSMTFFKKLRGRFEPYTFLILRICFGIGILFASFYAKFLHSQLALDTVIQYHLTDYFHFDPLFVVLGAFIIESIVGVFIILGFEIRFTAFVFLVFLTLSLLYFGEAIWPHIVLLGLNFALIAHGYDRYTVGALMGKKTHLEPVL